MIDLNKLPSQMPDEKIQGVYRRHPITIFGLYVSLFVVIILPFAGYFTLRFMQASVLQNPQNMALVVMGAGLLLMFTILFLYQQFLDYWLDMWIVTNRRIINIEQRGLFSRTTSELRLYRIQDVTAEVTGFLHSMLDYGMVYVQTAGEKEYFAFEDVPHPNQISKDILHLAEIDRKEHLEEAMEAIEQTTIDRHDDIRENAAKHLEP